MGKEEGDIIRERKREGGRESALHAGWRPHQVGYSCNMRERYQPGPAELLSGPLRNASNSSRSAPVVRKEVEKAKRVNNLPNIWCKSRNKGILD